MRWVIVLSSNESPGNGRRNIEQVWYTGKMMGETLGATLAGKRTAYRPGNWFNSAKFFDIEYQTYGWVMSKLREGEEHFYWEHPSGKKSIRINFEKETGKFLGVNVFGMRLRHELFDRWLTAGKDVGYVLEHLADAGFDPEFFERSKKEIVASYNKKYGRSLRSLKRDVSRIFNLR